MLSKTFMTATAAAANITPSSSIISLTAPFTPASLAKIRDALAGPAQGVSAVPNPTEPSAAVLIPFCNVNNIPGVLLEVRGKLRSHAGEVSFPGGRVDETDPSFLATALRETHEEVGILPGQVELIGQFGPPELSLKGLRVWPYVGFIHPRRMRLSCESDAHSRQTGLNIGMKNTRGNQDASDDDDIDTPLPSISLVSLTISQPEVANIFHLPLTAFTSRTRLKTYEFRGGRPYWAIDVSDLVPPAGPPESSVGIGQSEVSGGKLEVWGLTGWYLSLLMKVLKVYQ